ncbi:MAG: hypothetical protein DRP64_18795 [Verrucomicrobia bacterium]|nr:MAG: hypothetical protein DRP64_18795 [Verrucomicrobiota bacterium]
MALTPFQEEVCRLIARNRVASGESYIAGGVALNVALDAPRLSRDIDIFHDSAEALQISWEQDRVLLEEQGLQVEVVRDAQAYVEAVIRSKDDQVLLQWVRDSAYRFFPLVEDECLGLTLHPFDLATNKVLALVGRLEIRDWIDVQESTRKIQPLGLLAWAACGKDPGFSPLAILNEAARSSHYSAEELDRLDFAGSPPDLAALSSRWKEMLKTAHQMIDLLPSEHAGQCLLEEDGKLFSGDLEQLESLLGKGENHWHCGTLGGVLPEIVG